MQQGVLPAIQQVKWPARQTHQQPQQRQLKQVAKQLTHPHARHRQRHQLESIDP